MRRNNLRESALNNQKSRPVKGHLLRLYTQMNFKENTTPPPHLSVIVIHLTKLTIDDTNLLVLLSRPRVLYLKLMSDRLKFFFYPLSSSHFETGYCRLFQIKAKKEETLPWLILDRTQDKNCNLKQKDCEKHCQEASFYKAITWHFEPLLSWEGNWLF